MKYSHPKLEHSSQTPAFVYKNDGTLTTIALKYQLAVSAA
jgi:hypothetical protein